MRIEALVPLQWVDRGHGIMTAQVFVRRRKETPEGPAHLHAPELS
jgi:hypothetical protein